MWTLAEEGGTSTDDSKDAKAFNRKLHQTIRKVTEDIARFNFNTALAAIMELSNATADYLKKPAEQRDQKLCAQVADTLVRLLSPYAPHWADELWTAALGNEGSVYQQQWPTYDEAQAAEDEVERAVMIGGKVRAKITTPADADEQTIVDAALEAVADRIAGKTVRKTIVAPTVVNVVAN